MLKNIFRKIIKNKKIKKKVIKQTKIGLAFVPASEGGTIGSLLKPTSPAASASNSSFLLPACCSLSVGMVSGLSGLGFLSNLILK